MTKGNINMTFDSQRINDIAQRILSPKTDADRDMMWVAITMLLVGLLLG